MINSIYYPATTKRVWFINGRRLKGMDKKFNVVMRTGKTIDMLAELETLQEVYYQDLQASVNSFDTYYDVSNETRNDLIKVKTALSVFELLGYIDHVEYDAMFEAASQQRTTLLEGLTKNE